MPVSRCLKCIILSIGILLAFVALALPIKKIHADHLDLPNCADEIARQNVMEMIHEHFVSAWEQEPLSQYLTPWDLSSLYLTHGVMIENNHDAEYIRCKTFVVGTRDIEYARQQGIVDQFIDGYWTNEIKMYDVIYTIYQDQSDPDSYVLDFVWKKLVRN